MKVLVVGNGGREHALAWKIAEDPAVETVFVAPGNAGTANDAKLQNVSLDVLDFDGLSGFAQEQNVALTVIGPEAPLVEGIVDHFEYLGLPCFGPSKAAAQLEGSKAFTKDFLARQSIPTADYQNFTDVDQALAYLQKVGAPIVIKADGLAAGKGVIVAMTLKEAEDAVTDMLSGNAFGDAGCRVVIEEFLEGEEASFIVIADGEDCIAMATSQDHKRVGEGDTGPNTGGMGAYSPAPVVTNEVHQRIMDQVINPTLKGMSEEGNYYRGFLYAGLMISPEGQPKVIEFNCRFGDPETQPIMMRLNSALAPLCSAAIEGTLSDQSPDWDEKPAVGVVLAAGGYPASYQKGTPISGLENASTVAGKVFHAGTKNIDGHVTTNGGRVLCATALGESVSAAAENAYTLAKEISWDGMFYRNDIAYRAIAREKS